MAVKYVKDFSFDKSFGYTGSSAAPKGAQTNADAKRIPAVMKAMPGKGAQTSADVKRMPPAMPAKAPVMRDDSEPTAEEIKLMRQAREYKREDKATSDAAKAQMGFKNGGNVKADLKQDKKMVASAVHKHEKAQHPGEPLTKLKKGGPASAAGRDPRIPMLKCGGSYKK
jgi:hypothetical protein